MIDALIAGKVIGIPKQGTDKNGKPYTTMAIRAAAGNGEGMICSVIAFRGPVCEALNALQEGDSIAVSGALTPKVYQAKTGGYRPALDMVVHAVLTPYHVSRKRRAVDQTTDDTDEGYEP